MKGLLQKCAVFGCLLTLPGMLSAQMVVEGGTNAWKAVRKVLLSDTPGIEVLKVSYVGAPKAMGTFQANFKHNSMMTAGIVLSTGLAESAVGPNTSGHYTGKNMYPGKESLRKLSKNRKTYDAASLSFEFKALTDSISFRYLFASEEYPEYVNRGVNDVFAFFLTDVATDQRVNLAVLDDGVSTVCVDNIHAGKNKKLFVRSGLWITQNMEEYRSDAALGERARYLQYDGFTVVLEAGAKLIPGQVYRLEMAIADVGDNIYDSAIFLEAKSFKNAGTLARLESIKLQELFSSEMVDEDPTVQKGVKNIQFALGSAEVEGEETLEFLGNLAKVLMEGDWERVEVVGHTDSTGTEADNLVLSQKRAENIVLKLEQLGVAKDLLQASGKGESEPVDPQNLMINRRVEFLFY